MPSQIRGRQIELVDGNPLELIEPDARELLRERIRIADEDDRQPIRMEVGFGDALDIVDGNRVDPLAERLQLLQIQSVEHGVEDLQGNRTWRLDGEREAAGQVGLRIGELPLADALAL